MPFTRIIYFSFGLFLTGLGLAGVIIPGLPTTIFMILAAACFFRSSTKMYNWVINHPLFGESVLRFRSGEGMPIKAKYTSIIMMWFFILTSIFFFWFIFDSTRPSRSYNTRFTHNHLYGFSCSMFFSQLGKNVQLGD